jgi:hypothetical protein
VEAVGGLTYILDTKVLRIVMATHSSQKSSNLFWCSSDLSTLHLQSYKIKGTSL